ncbi:MAG: AAA family ATPase [Proteobacteria bacterium]|nr:AAA family ATPase [Pseudomonadota bacterium]
MYRNFGQILSSKRIVVCVGSGGVGKTTTAAALALEAARQGRRALVLTIDPARRLANSLGLEELGHEVTRISDEILSAAGPDGIGGQLHAMMLDQKRAFDEVVARHASDPRAIARILANPVYAQISSSLAGAQEYAAMAKLQEFDRADEFETIIVDTPPTAHALDFLDAPEKLTRAIDSPAIEWFRKLNNRDEKSGWSVVGRTGSYVLQRLSKFVGKQFLQDLAVFFTEFNDILGGFRQRAEETFALLRTDSVGFVLIASPEPLAVREALFFHERLVSSSMPFAGFVVNKVHNDLPLDPGGQRTDDIARLIATEPAVAGLGFQPSTLRMASEVLLTAHTELQILARADREAIGRLLEATGESTLLKQVPVFRGDVHDIATLAALGRYLMD